MDPRTTAFCLTKRYGRSSKAHELPVWTFLFNLSKLSYSSQKSHTDVFVHEITVDHCKRTDHLLHGTDRARWSQLYNCCTVCRLALSALGGSRSSHTRMTSCAVYITATHPAISSDIRHMISPPSYGMLNVSISSTFSYVVRFRTTRMIPFLLRSDEKLRFKFSLGVLQLA